jgi:dolichol-phosphate mannosyltransferase
MGLLTRYAELHDMTPGSAVSGRISRRGLAGAALEGMLSTSAEFIVLMDGDLQHDETKIAEMLSLLRKGEADVVLASRYCETETEVFGLSRMRQFGSRLATRLAQVLLKTNLSDPMSGFFMLRRDVVDSVAQKLSPPREHDAGHAPIA